MPHKDTSAWETLLQAIINSKLVITNSWPLLMENPTGLRSFRRYLIRFSDIISMSKIKKRKNKDIMMINLNQN